MFFEDENDNTLPGGDSETATATDAPEGAETAPGEEEEELSDDDIDSDDDDSDEDDED